MPPKKGQKEFGPPPGNKIQWRVTHNTLKAENGDRLNDIKTAQTAFNAASAMGWNLSECTCRRVDQE